MGIKIIFNNGKELNYPDIEFQPLANSIDKKNFFGFYKFRHLKFYNKGKVASFIRIEQISCIIDLESIDD